MVKNSQTEANKRWQEKNKRRAIVQMSRSRARSFIKNQAESEDVEELRLLLNDRENELQSSEEVNNEP